MTATTMTRKTDSPWYRQGWPWFLIMFPAIAVVAGLVTFWIAYATFDGMVVDDYYKEGRTIDMTVARSVKAAELGLSADVKLRSEDIEIVLASSNGAVLPAQLIVTIIHPTRAGQDQHLVLEGRSGVYSGETATLGTGKWLLQLEDESRSWRLNGTTHLPAEMEFRVVPYDS